MVVHTCNLTIQEFEGRSLQVEGQPGPHNETPSQNKETNHVVKAMEVEEKKKKWRQPEGRPSREVGNYRGEQETISGSILLGKGE